jgi:hypothetical protein
VSSANLDVPQGVEGPTLLQTPSAVLHQANSEYLIFYSFSGDCFVQQVWVFSLYPIPAGGSASNGSMGNKGRHSQRSAILYRRRGMGLSDGSNARSTMAHASVNRNHMSHAIDEVALACVEDEGVCEHSIICIRAFSGERLVCQNRDPDVLAGWVSPYSSLL